MARKKAPAETKVESIRHKDNRTNIPTEERLRRHCDGHNNCFHSTWHYAAARPDRRAMPKVPGRGAVRLRLAVREDFGPESDIDFLIVFQGDDYGPWMGKLQRLEEELGALLGREVELVPKEGVVRSRTGYVRAISFQYGPGDLWIVTPRRCWTSFSPAAV